MPLSTLRYLLGLAGVFLRFRLHHLVPAQHIPSRMGRGLLAVLMACSTCPRGYVGPAGGGLGVTGPGVHQARAVTVHPTGYFWSAHLSGSRATPRSRRPRRLQSKTP